MAQLAISAVGAAVGFMVGGPMGASIGWALGSAAGGLLFAPKNRTEVRIADYPVTESVYGQTLPIVLGAGLCPAKVIWQGEPREEKNEREVGKNNYVTETRRFVSFYAAFSQGPIQTFRRVWINKKLAYSEEHDDIVEALLSGAFAEKVEFFYGTADQAPWWVAEAVEGAVPGYQFMACMGFRDWDITETGGIPQIEAEVIEFADRPVPTHINNFGMYDDTLLSMCAGWGPDEYQIETTDWLNHLSSTDIGGFCWRRRVRDLTKDDFGAHWPDPVSGLSNVVEMFSASGVPWKDYGDATEDPEGRTVLGYLNPFGTNPWADYGRVYTVACINDPRLALQIVFGQPEGTEHPYETKLVLMSACVEPYDSATTVFISLGDVESWDLTSAHMVRSGSRIYYIRHASAETTTRVVIGFPVSARDAYTPIVPNEVDGADTWVGKFEFGDDSQASVSQTFTGQATGADWIGVDEVTGDIYIRFAASEWIWRLTADLELRRIDPDDPESDPVRYEMPLQPGCLQAMHVWNNMLVTAHKWNQDTVGTWFGQYDLHPDGSATLMGEVEVSALGLPVEPAGREHEPVFVPLRNGVFLTRTSQWTMLPRAADEGRSLAEVITILSDPAIGASDLNVADVEDVLVRGYQLDNRTARGTAIQPLLGCYGADLFESDGKLKVVKRGAAAVATIPYEDLGAERGESKPETPTEERTREVSTALPVRLDLHYMQHEAAYERGNTLAQRMHGDSDEWRTLEVPVTLTAQEAARSAWRNLTEAWAQRTSKSWTTTVKYLALEPGDAVLMETRGGTLVREKITAKEEDNGLLNFGSVTDDDGAVVQVAAGVQGPPADGLKPPTTGTLGVVFEVPPLADADGLGAILYGVGSPLSADRPWPGAIWFVSELDDSGLNSAANLAASSRVGSAVAALPDWDVGRELQAPATHRLEVSIAGELLEEYSPEEQLAGSGLAAVTAGETSRTELIRYRTAEVTADGTYVLDGLQRGVLGTDYAATGHAAGDRVILLPNLAATVVTRLPRQLSELNALRRWRAVTHGRDVISAPSQVHSFQAGTLRPLPPVHITMTVRANGDRRIGWIRRNRVYQDLWLTGVDVPMSESAETYHVEILDPVSGDVLREATVTGQAYYDYTVADYTADFGSAPTELRVRVAQVSALVGAGHWADSELSAAADGGTLVLQLEFEGTHGSTTITDSTGRHSPTAHGGAAISTAEFVYGSSSLALGGAGQYVSVPNSSDFDFSGGEEWNVTLRFRTPSVAAGLAGIVALVKSPGTANADNGFSIRRSGAAIVAEINSGGTAYGATAVGTLSANTWHKISMKKQGSFLVREIDGVQVGTNVDLTGVPINFPVGSVLRIGEFFGNYPTTGYVDRLRINKGSALEG